MRKNPIVNCNHVFPDGTKCNRRKESKIGLCGAHMWRYKKGKDMDVPLRKRRKKHTGICDVPHCGRVTERGLLFHTT